MALSHYEILNEPTIALRIPKDSSSGNLIASGDTRTRNRSSRAFKLVTSNAIREGVVGMDKVWVAEITLSDKLMRMLPVEVILCCCAVRGYRTVKLRGREIMFPIQCYLSQRSAQLTRVLTTRSHLGRPSG